MRFSGTSGLKRHPETLKKANKGCRGHFKDQRVKKWKNIDFIAYLWSFGVKNEDDSVFWSFKVKKAKKATLVARKAKSQRSNAKNLWLVLYCLCAIIVLPQRPILLYFSDISLLKAKIGLVGPQNVRKFKIDIKWFKSIY